MPIIPVLRRLKHEDHKFEVSLSCRAGVSKHKNKNKTNKPERHGIAGLACPRPWV
jgi:hypothetical protein